MIWVSWLVSCGRLCGVLCNLYLEGVSPRYGHIATVFLTPCVYVKINHDKRKWVKIPQKDHYLVATCVEPCFSIRSMVTIRNSLPKHFNCPMLTALLSAKCQSASLCSIWTSLCQKQLRDINFLDCWVHQVKLVNFKDPTFHCNFWKVEDNQSAVGMTKYHPNLGFHRDLPIHQGEPKCVGPTM